MNRIHINDRSDAESCGHEHRPKRLAYSVAEAAAVTGLGRTTLYALIGNGELASCKIGKRRLIASVDLEELIGRRRGAAA